MGRSSKKSHVVAVAAAASPASGKKRGNSEEETEIKLKLKKKKEVAYIKKKEKKIQEFNSEKDSSSQDFGSRKQLVQCTEKQKFSSEKKSSSQDPKNQSWLAPCREKPNIGEAASSKKESREEPVTPIAPEVQSTRASKTVIARNVSIFIEKSDVIEFFKKVGEVVDVRYKDGATCYIEFATDEAAEKALELDGQCLGNKEIFVRPETESTGASKTLVAKNLPSSYTKSDVIEFFKQAGEIVDVRFSSRQNGDFRGYCHIEFATEEAAKKAAELNGECLLGRPVVLGFARETIFIRGFDTSLGFDQIRSSLEELFSTCGEILWMEIPTVHYTSIPRGMAFIEFYDFRAYPKALAMNGHKLGDSTLTVEDAMPLHFDVKPTGPRRRINGRHVGPYGGSFYATRYFPHRGYGGAGIGKHGSIYHLPQGKKTKFDYDSPEGEQEGHDDD